MVLSVATHFFCCVYIKLFLLNIKYATVRCETRSGFSLTQISSCI